jgi:hypothetical protein
VGPIKADRYGGGLLDVVRRAVPTAEPRPPGPPPPSA